MPLGLPRKFRLLFVIQVLAVTVFISLVAWLVLVGSKQIVFKGLLMEDAAYFWQQYQRDPSLRPTHSPRQDGVLIHGEPAAADRQRLSPSLLSLPPGFHDRAAEGWLVWVEDAGPGRLILLYDRLRAQHIMLLVVLLPASVTLLGFYLAAWYSYRTSRRLVMPVNWLARQVTAWDPRQSGSSELDSAWLSSRVTGETRQLAQALQDMAQRVREHIQREHEFTRDASHELRTPLTVIRMATDLALAEQGLTRHQVRTLRRIQQAGRDMEAVLESQLILAREAGIEAQMDSVLVARVLEEEVNHAREGMDGRPIVIDLEIDDPQLHILASEHALRVVVRQLLENACLYTLEGRIRVSLCDGWLMVADTGIGMNREQLERAFEPFYRGNPSDGAGSGLGLSIVRRLCRRFEWPLEMRSEPERGTQARVGLTPSVETAG